MVHFFVHQVIYLGNSLPRNVAAAKRLQGFWGSLGKYLEESSVAGREGGTAD